MDPTQRLQLQLHMTALAEGDRTAFAPAYALVWPLATRFAQRLVQNSADADDAAQSALLKVFERCATYDSKRDALAWILSITYFECRTLRQRQRRRNEAPIEPEAHSHTPQLAIEQRLMRQALVDVARSLPPHDVETLLQYLTDQNPDVPGPTFRKRVERALSRLRLAWSSRHGTD